MILGSGTQATVREAERVRRAISEQGTAALEVAGSRAGALISGIQTPLNTAPGWAASVTSLAPPLPTLDLCRRGTRSLMAYQWSSVADRRPGPAESDEIGQRRYEDRERADLQRPSEGGSEQIVATIDANEAGSLAHQEPGGEAEIVYTVSSDSDSDDDSYVTAELINDVRLESIIPSRND